MSLAAPEIKLNQLLTIMRKLSKFNYGKKI